MDVDGFTDPYLASLYEIECPWHPSDDFYLELVLTADAVLDVGCGTGLVLGTAVERGHRGRLVGIDPAEGMLIRARRRAGVHWVHGVLTGGRWNDEFDLVIMTGHAFQELRGDDDIAGFLAAAHAALRPGGRLAFETRNPLRRAWEGWHGRTRDITDPDGVAVHLRQEVENVDAAGTRGPVVTFTETYTAGPWPEPRTSRSRLRFVPVEHLDALLADAGFGVDERYGDWDRSPFTDAGEEIVTIASRS